MSFNNNHIAIVIADERNFLLVPCLCGKADDIQTDLETANCSTELLLEAQACASTSTTYFSTN